jgi:hypothetical protein
MNEFLATTAMHPDFAGSFAEDLRRGRSAGSATLIAGMVNLESIGTKAGRVCYDDSDQ